jgi:hypothetical protein
VKPTSALTGLHAENVVAEYLRHQGYLAFVDTKGPGATDVEAWYRLDLRHIIQVKAALVDTRDPVAGSHALLNPPMPSHEEIQQIRCRALLLGTNAWIAHVLLDDQTLNPFGDIRWTLVN